MPADAALSVPAAARDATAPSPRERILDDAATLFLERGYAGTSLRSLAAAVGLQPGSLYHHFGSKDELLAEILRIGIDTMHVAFDAAWEATHDLDDPVARLEAHVRAHLAALFENGPYTAAHVTTFRTAPESVRALVVPVRNAYEGRWAALLDEIGAAGRLAPDTDRSLARLMLLGAMNGAVDWFDVSRNNLDHVAAGICGQFWRGVAA